MEHLLLIAILVLVILILKRMNSRSRKMEEVLDNLHKKIDHLNRTLSTTDTEAPGSPSAEVRPGPTNIPDPIPTPEPIVPRESVSPVRADIPAPPISPISEKAPEEVIRTARPISPPIPKQSFYRKFKENNPDLEKFIGENLINKIGILILVLGISFFVKYAIDKNWINEPARVGIGILCGALVMGIAHKLKKNYAAFSSVLVAGALSIFYFTIGIAFQEYELFGQTTAFIIMVVITAFSTLVSISYNRQELGILSLIGGFSVPFIVSTGEGNYLVLFSYIAILNMGILGIAYFKKWKILTFVAFLFTTLLYGAWLGSTIFSDKLPHLGAILFATLFYFIFSITTVLHNVRNKGTFTRLEYFILVGNTFFFFSVGIIILQDWGSGLKGLFTLLLALYNIIYAAILYKKFGLDKNAIYLLIGLALTFITLTFPIQFEGNQITLFWAAEAVLLFWLSQKSKIDLFKTGAVIVQVLAIISLMMDWERYQYALDEPLRIILNPIFIAGLAICISLAGSYLILKKEVRPLPLPKSNFPLRPYLTALLIILPILAYFTGILEVDYQAKRYFANSYSALSFPVTYHFVFSALLLYWATTFKNRVVTQVMAGIAALNLLVYIVYFYTVPTQELIENAAFGLTGRYAFYLHYMVLICLAYFAFHLWKATNLVPSIKILNHKIMPWLFVFSIIYILSNEIMVHSLQFTTLHWDQTTWASVVPDPGSAEYSYPYEAYNRINHELDGIKRQIIKIGYPIFWGILSFVFLIIGIKGQIKNLRIMALALLGMTIIKLFVYDIKDVSETGKIIAFILLGILILIISFVYQKIKRLVVNTPQSRTDEE